MTMRPRILAVRPVAVSAVASSVPVPNQQIGCKERPKMSYFVSSGSRHLNAINQSVQWLRKAYKLHRREPLSCSDSAARASWRACPFPTRRCRDPSRTGWWTQLVTCSNQNGQDRRVGDNSNGHGDESHRCHHLSRHWLLLLGCSTHSCRRWIQRCVDCVEAFCRIIETRRHHAAHPFLRSHDTNVSFYTTVQLYTVLWNRLRDEIQALLPDLIWMVRINFLISTL